MSGRNSAFLKRLTEGGDENEIKETVLDLTGDVTRDGHSTRTYDGHHFGGIFQKEITIWCTGGASMPSSLTPVVD